MIFVSSSGCQVVPMLRVNSFKLGLTVAVQSPAQTGQKSAEFGVLQDNSKGVSKRG